LNLGLWCPPSADGVLCSISPSADGVLCSISPSADGYFFLHDLAVFGVYVFGFGAVIFLKIVSFMAFFPCVVHI